MCFSSTAVEHHDLVDAVDELRRNWVFTSAMTAVLDEAGSSPCIC